MRYPDSYKCNTMYITKFERNYRNELVYQFKNVFPKSMATIPVAYGAADLLKVTVTFNFDRYIMIPKRATSTTKGTQKDNTIKSLLATDDTEAALNAIVNSSGTTVLDAANASIG